MGITSRNDDYEVAVLVAGKTAVVMKFPATAVSVEAIKGFLASHENSVRLAVAGVAALSLALALGKGTKQETFIVSLAIADQAVALARYAEHTA